MWTDIPSAEDLLRNVRRPDRDIVMSAEMLAESTDHFDRAAAVGLLARLGAWCSREPEATLAAIGQGEGPASIARAWARSLTREQAVLLGCLAMEEACSWAQYVGRTLASGDPIGESVGMLLAYWRDRIASVCWVLCAAGRHEDVLAIEQTCTWPQEVPLPACGDALLDAVAQAEPTAGWVRREQ